MAKRENPQDRTERIFLQKVYETMFIGLMVSAIAAYFVVSFPGWGIIIGLLAAVPLLIMYLIVLASVFFYPLHFNFGSITDNLARGMSLRSLKFFFLIYSLCIGLLISSVLFMLKVTTIHLAFLAAAIMFGAMIIYSKATKKNPSNLENLALMLVVGALATVLLESITILPGFISGLPLSCLEQGFLISMGIIVLFSASTALYVKLIRKITHFENDSEMPLDKQIVVAALEINLMYLAILIIISKAFKER